MVHKEYIMLHVYNKHGVRANYIMLHVCTHV